MERTDGRKISKILKSRRCPIRVSALGIPTVDLYLLDFSLSDDDDSGNRDSNVAKHYGWTDGQTVDYRDAEIHLNISQLLTLLPRSSTDPQKDGFQQVVNGGKVTNSQISNPTPPPQSDLIPQAKDSEKEPQKDPQKRLKVGLSFT